jgi:hypothetical protein
MDKENFRIVVGQRVIATGWWALTIELLFVALIFLLGAITGAMLP